MKIIKNYLYNVGYQLISIILPIITVPYIARIFSPQQIGLNAYTLSIAQYFVLFAGLGIGIYGNRTIAYVKNDDKKRIKIFWSLFFTILITSILSLCFYFIFIFFMDSNNFEIHLIQSLYIISVAVDISWLFMGMEDFKEEILLNKENTILRTLLMEQVTSLKVDVNKNTTIPPLP